MKILNSIKKIFCKNNNKASFKDDNNIYKLLIGVIPESMLLLDKNKYIIDIYNASAEIMAGYSAEDFIGNHISLYADDPSSPFRKACILLNDAFDKTVRSGVPIEFKYKILDSYFETTISKLSDDIILCQARNISNILKRERDSEAKIRNELSMALTAGRLIPWSYNAETKLITSPQKNNIIDGNTSFADILLRVFPEHRHEVLQMYEDILSHKTLHREITVKVKTLEGEYIWMNVHAIPHIYALNGDVAVIVGSQKDITEQHEHTEKIKLLNKQNDLILNNIKSGLVYVNSDYKVIWENLTKVFDTNESVSNFYRPGTYCYESFNRSSPCKNCIAQRSMQTHKSELVELSIDKETHLEVIANPILGNNNTIDAFILRFDDVSEKKKSVQQLEKAKQAALSANQMLWTIIDHLPAYVFVKDANDNYKYIIANKQFCNSFGFSENDIIGKTDYDIFADKNEADKYRKDDTKTIETGETKIIDGEHVTVKGNATIWYTVKTPLINRNDNKFFLVGIGLDVTDNRKAYYELAIAKKKAEESDVLKSAFLANMSHEIRTPLNAIVGFSEILKDTYDEKERNEYWNIIKTNNELLLRLISDILDLSKIESGMIELKSTKFNLAVIFNNIYNMLKPRNKNERVEFICKNPYEKCIVSLDEDRITQIITNFVTNSFKFTSQGEVVMGYEYVNNGIRFYCNDTGIGIPKDKIDEVFIRFSKLDDFAQGTGLGTSICKAIADAYGGEIGVTSEVNKGSYFWAWIPCSAEIE